MFFCNLAVNVCLAITYSISCNKIYAKVYQDTLEFCFKVYLHAQIRGEGAYSVPQNFLAGIRGGTGRAKGRDERG